MGDLKREGHAYLHRWIWVMGYELDMGAYSLGYAGGTNSVL